MVKYPKSILVYVSVSEKDQLEALANEYGLSLSRFLVLSALGKVKFGGIHE